VLETNFIDYKFKWSSLYLIIFSFKNVFIFSLPTIKSITVFVIITFLKLIIKIFIIIVYTHYTILIHLLIYYQPTTSDVF